MILGNTFNFGKYKGLTLLDVVTGTKTIERSDLVSYVNYLLNENIGYQQEFMGVHDEKIFHGIEKFVVSDTVIQIMGLLDNFGQHDTNRLRIGNITETLNSYLTGAHYLSIEPKSIFNYLNNLSLGGPRIIGPNIDYLRWCIENVEKFFIEEDDLNKIESLSVTYFKGISVSYLGNDCYYFEPVLETKNPSFSYKTKKINLQKIEDCYNEEEHFDDDFDTYHAGENPWIDVFGEGDEADAAYWNTD